MAPAVPSQGWSSVQQPPLVVRQVASPVAARRSSPLASVRVRSSPRNSVGGSLGSGRAQSADAANRVSYRGVLPAYTQEVPHLSVAAPSSAADCASDQLPRTVRQFSVAASSTSAIGICDSQAPHICTVEELRELILHERHERMAGIAALTVKLDEELSDLHRNMPCFQEEFAKQRCKLDEVSETQASCLYRLDKVVADTEGLAQSLEEARQEAVPATSDVSGLSRRLHDVDSWARAEISFLQEGLNEIRATLLAPKLQALNRSGCDSDLEVPDLAASVEEGMEPSDRVEEADADDEGLERESATGLTEVQITQQEAEEMRKAMEQLFDAHQDAHIDFGLQLSDMEKRITEEWTGLRGWVDAAVVALVNRISALECAMHSEMDERSEQIQAMSSSVAVTTEQMASMKDKLDKVVFESRLSAVSNALRNLPGKSGESVRSVDEVREDSVACRGTYPGTCVSSDVDNCAVYSSSGGVEPPQPPTPIFPPRFLTPSRYQSPRATLHEPFNGLSGTPSAEIISGTLSSGSMKAPATPVTPVVGLALSSGSAKAPCRAASGDALISDPLVNTARYYSPHGRLRQGFQAQATTSVLTSASYQSSSSPAMQSKVIHFRAAS